jgi:hypothetical protein
VFGMDGRFGQPLPEVDPDEQARVVPIAKRHRRNGTPTFQPGSQRLPPSAAAVHPTGMGVNRLRRVHGPRVPRIPHTRGGEIAARHIAPGAEGTASLRRTWGEEGAADS